VATSAFQAEEIAVRQALEHTKAAKTIYKVAEGHFEDAVDDSVLPYGGYWWPYATLELSSGPYSPLGKYDAYVTATTGANPESADWESAHHSDTAVEWGGHCNGWAASSILHEEISQPLWDPNNEVVIYDNDVNGMFAEASFCVDAVYYGARNYGDGDLEDVS